MKKYNLYDMTRGWVVGNFDPSVIKTEKCEVGIKSYKSGESEKKHYHLLTDEVTVIVSGRVRMNGKEYINGDIIVTEKGEATDFECLEDSITVVYKDISVKGDKYICEDNKYRLDIEDERDQKS